MPHHPAMPHGAFEEVFPDLFMVRSSFRIGAGFTIARNMIVLRQGGELVIVNSARLSDDGEAELGKLGKVAHVVRLASQHGVDDPYYVERFGATLWGAPGTKHAVPGKDLRSDAHPFTSAQVFLFEHTNGPEAAILLPIEGGALVTGDCYQNWTTFALCSWLARRVMPVMGFGPAMLSKPWLKHVGPNVHKDYARLVELPFRHLIPGHGTVLRDVARDRLPAAVAARFPKA